MRPKMSEKEIQKRIELLQKFTIDEVSDKLNISLSSLRKFCKDYGLEIKRTPKSERHNEKLSMIDFENRINLNRIRGSIVLYKVELKHIFESYGYNESQIAEFIKLYITPLELAINQLCSKYPKKSTHEIHRCCEAFEGILRIGEHLNQNELRTIFGIEQYTYDYWRKKYGKDKS
jgi:hypothetical protein